MENWIQEQAARNTSAFDMAMLTQYPDAGSYLRDPERYFDRVCLDCNYLDAAKLLPWKDIIPPGARILDLAGGTGWLTAYLSSFDAVAEITMVDASRTYLETNLPVAIQRLGGNAARVKPVVGYFSPLLFADNSLDLVVVSSSLHHADNLESVLREILRVLKPGARCYVLNEVPVSQRFYLRTMLVSIARTMLATLRRNYTDTSQAVSASGILCDPHLGDRMYPLWFWERAISRAGFILRETIDTGMPPVKTIPDISMTHFVCEKPAQSQANTR